MQGFKGVIVVATIIAAAATLGACRKEVRGEPLKLGAADVAVAVVALISGTFLSEAGLRLFENAVRQAVGWCSRRFSFVHTAPSGSNLTFESRVAIAGTSLTYQMSGQFDPPTKSSWIEPDI